MLAHYNAPNIPRVTPPGVSGFFASGVLLERLVDGVAFSSPDDQQQVAALHSEFPSVELRGSLRSERLRSLRLVAPHEIRSIGWKCPGLPDISYDDALEQLHSDIPALSESRAFTPVKLAPYMPKRTRDIFIVATPIPEESEVINNDIWAIRRSIEQMAQVKSIPWGEIKTELTVAYIPGATPKRALERTLQALRSYRGQKLTLSAVDPDGTKA